MGESFPSTPSLPHDIFLEGFYAYQEPASERARRILLCVSALLLFLALASYSPLDPSLNSASILTKSHAARNWIGIFGAYLSDLILQFWGVGSFLLPIFMAMLGARWFRSRAVQTPIAKTLGGIWLLMFVPCAARHPARTLPLDGRDSD